MKIRHLICTVAALAVVMTAARDPMLRVFMIVFTTGLGEVVFGVTALLALFQTVGALGEAKGLVAHAEAIAATSVVLVVAAALMSGWLFAGVWCVLMTA